MRIDPNTSIVDLAFNISGSLARIPAVLEQLPVGERIGFDNIPNPAMPVPSTWQTWTPDLSGLEVTLNVPMYNELAVRKAPYNTNLYHIQEVVAYGDRVVELLWTM